MPSIPDLRSLDRTCGGTGWLNCECGGDFCACHLHGGIDCPGCEDCRDHDDDDGWPSDEEEDPRDIAFREPDCDQCGGPTREGFCPICQ